MLDPDSGYFILYPVGGSLMPADPFNFRVVDLLHDYATGKNDIDPNWDLGGYSDEDWPDRDYLASFGREARRMWPRKELSDSNLVVGSDDIEVNLDDNGYWLPEEDEPLERDKKLLSVSEQ